MSALINEDKSFWDKQKELDIAHLRNPEPGDYWQEMLCPYLVVLHVDRAKITICEERIEYMDNTWEWDLSKAKIVDRDYLYKRVKYSDPQMRGKFVAHVRPRAHVAFCEDFLDDEIKQTQNKLNALLAAKYKRKKEKTDGATGS